MPTPTLKLMVSKPRVSFLSKTFSWTIARRHSTCTMDLVSNDSYSSCSTYTLYEERDFDPSSYSSAQPVDQKAASSFWNGLAKAASWRRIRSVSACEMDLLEAASSKDHYEKIVLLVNSCQAEKTTNEGLTPRGVGQALGLSRRTANFLNAQTELIPQLIVVPPSRGCIETAMHGFSHYSPHSVRATEWVCHPDAESSKTEDGQNLAELALQRSAAVVDWMRARSEKVLVVASDSQWLQAFGYTTRYGGGPTAFRQGEMRVVGLNYS